MGACLAWWVARVTRTVDSTRETVPQEVQHPFDSLVSWNTGNTSTRIQELSSNFTQAAHIVHTLLCTFTVYYTEYIIHKMAPGCNVRTHSRMYVHVEEYSSFFQWLGVNCHCMLQCLLYKWQDLCSCQHTPTLTWSPGQYLIVCN